MSPSVNMPASRCASLVLSGSPRYSKSVPIVLRMWMVPGTNGGAPSSLPWAMAPPSSSSGWMRTMKLGSGWPTDPGFCSQVSAVMTLTTPPSVAP